MRFARLLLRLAVGLTTVRAKEIRIDFQESAQRLVDVTVREGM